MKFTQGLRRNLESSYRNLKIEKKNSKDIRVIYCIKNFFSSCKLQITKNEFLVLNFTTIIFSLFKNIKLELFKMTSFRNKENIAFSFVWPLLLMKLNFT